jgi:hypothetical protein
MGLSHSPSMITNGLVLCLDAGNRRSYPGSGTTWTDLSGNGNNGTMFGTVPFSTDLVPCFDFSSATGSFTYTTNMGFTFASNMVTTTGSFSFSCWVKGMSGDYGQPGLFSNAGSSDGFRFGVNQSSVYYLFGTGASYTESGVNHSSLSTSTWHNIVGVFDRSAGQFQSYVNGIYQGFGSFPSGSTAYTSVAPGIAKNPCCGNPKYKVSIFSVHNKALSAAEILQNYNALRGRFGL